MPNRRKWTRNAPQYSSSAQSRRAAINDCKKNWRGDARVTDDGGVVIQISTVGDFWLELFGEPRCAWFAPDLVIHFAAAPSFRARTAMTGGRSTSVQRGAVQISPLAGVHFRSRFVKKRVTGRRRWYRRRG